MKSRRDFIKTSALAGAGLTLLQSESMFAKDKDNKLRLGFIGVGMRGQNHLELAVRRADVDVVAVCDVEPVMMKDALDIVAKAGKPMVKVIPLNAREPSRIKRFGFMAGQINVPADFDRMGEAEIMKIFEGDA